jgi:Ca2+-binding EF-hand superfamily protein
MHKPPRAVAAPRHRRIAWLALLAIAAGAGPALAGDAETQALFDRLDANHDGQLAAAEIPADKERLFKRLLRGADADHDGQLSQQEFVAGLSAKSAARPDRELPTRQSPASETPAAAEKPAEAEKPAVSQPPVATLAPAARPVDPSAAVAVFAALDLDRDGSLSTEEIAKAPQSLAALDQDGNGGIATVEMQQSPVARANGPDLARVWQRLLQADKDSDGRLSQTEAPERMQRNFERVDTNKDGFIEEAEFKSSVARLRAAMGKKDS